MKRPSSDNEVFYLFFGALENQNIPVKVSEEILKNFAPIMVNLKYVTLHSHSYI